MSKDGGKKVTFEQYVDHEVQLRVHESRFKAMDSKLNVIISLLLSVIVSPLLVHASKLLWSYYV